MTQKRDRFWRSKSALISIFFSYKEISVRKIALKPLVRGFGHFAHFCAFLALIFALILRVILRPQNSLFLAPKMTPKISHFLSPPTSPPYPLKIALQNSSTHPPKNTPKITIKMSSGFQPSANLFELRPYGLTQPY